MRSGAPPTTRPTAEPAGAPSATGAATRDLSSPQGAGRVPSSRAPESARGEDRLGAGWLVLLLPVACCGGPLLIGALATTGALGWGALGAGVAAVIGVVLLVARRRAAACCEPAAEDGSRSPSSASTPTRSERP